MIWIFFCGLAKSYDSYQWHEKADMKVNNTNLPPLIPEISSD